MKKKHPDDPLWNEILNYNLDEPLSEYPFSIRLASENSWTQSFTDEAIIEYKKFAFLAAKSNQMVSPSETVDKVWHQHLVFTSSYNEFCSILGKHLHHIPGTGTVEEAAKFSAAKDYTATLYVETFGEQPANIWKHRQMFDALQLPKAKYKTQSLAALGILLFLGLSFPLYRLARPLIIEIENPDYLFLLFTLALICFTVLELYNRRVLRKIIRNSYKNSFLKNLTYLEIAYLRSSQVHVVIYPVLGQLIKKNLVLLEGEIFEIIKDGDSTTIEEYTVLRTLKEEGGSLTFAELLQKLSIKPCFSRIANTMEEFKKYFVKSAAFSGLFVINFLILALPGMIAFLRYLTGISRDKPVVIIFLTIAFFCFLSILYLNRLKNYAFSASIQELYPDSEEIGTSSNTAEWQSVGLGGTAALPLTLLTLIENDKKRRWLDNTGDYSSSDSSCSSDGGGSSCSSSCGGCGGGD